MEEVSIDRDRLVDGELVPNEYFCPICQDLLWEPRACASCQHLFCEKCLRTWLENPTSANKCPFRCQPFEERRCPPYVHSLLARLNIHCRNASFGCPAILSYDTLEYHEKSQCHYLTERCSECQQLVLLSKLDEHKQSAGLCMPQPIKCTICQNYVFKVFFRDHFHQCCQMKINDLIERTNAHQTLQLTADGQRIPPNPGMTFIQSIHNTIQLFEQQRQFSHLPTSLKGVDAARRAEQQRRGSFYHLLIMLKFIVMNWSQAPFFIFMLSISGLGIIGTHLFGILLILSNWIFTHIYRGFVLLILFSYLSNYVTSILVQIISDTSMIFSFGLLIFLVGCSTRISFELFEMNDLFNKQTIWLILCSIGILTLKIFFLLIRVYYWSMPIYVAATVSMLLNCYLTYKLHPIYVAAAAILRTNQLTMPV